MDSAIQEIGTKGVDSLIANIIEPRESLPEIDHDDWYGHLNLTLDGIPRRSPAGAWEVLCHYDDGDVPTWYPRRFDTTVSAMLAWEAVGLGKKHKAMLSEEDDGSWTVKTFRPHCRSLGKGPTVATAVVQAVLKVTEEEVKRGSKH